MTPASLHLMRLPDDPAARALPTAHLDESEHVHLARLPSAQLRAGFCLGRLLLKTLVARRTGIALHRVRLVPGAHGKPCLADFPRLSVNVSHVSGAVACIVAETAAVGVDIEDPGRRPLSDAARDRFLDEEERAWLDAARPGRGHEAFLALWTRKEAVLKADGRGLAMGIGQVRFGPDGRGGLALRDSERLQAARWAVRTGSFHGHPWAVAWRSEGLAASVDLQVWCAQAPDPRTDDPVVSVPMSMSMSMSMSMPGSGSGSGDLPKAMPAPMTRSSRSLALALAG
jgi:4'-phosphopantetheinyl transferase